MAMGYVFGKISDLHIKLPKAGLYVLLKASEAPLGAFYNEHRDRRGLFSAAMDESLSSLDRRREVCFDDGWFEPDILPPVARWMGERAGISFRCVKLNEISFDMTTHLPDLKTEPLQVDLWLNGVHLNACSLFRNGWLTLRVHVPDDLQVTSNEYFLELHASRTWQPRANTADPDQRDDREISIAVCNIVVQ
jgi:hypothetical protein